MSQFTLTFEGNLAAKPELEYTATGQALCRLRVALRPWRGLLLALWPEPGREDGRNRRRTVRGRPE